MTQNTSITIREAGITTADKLIAGMRGLLLKRFFKRSGFPVSIGSGVKFSQLDTIELGEWVRIRSGSEILNHVQMRNRVYVGRYCEIGANTLLEDDVTLADYVCILTDTHDRTNKRTGKMHSTGQTIIGAGSWIGDRVIILPQVRYIGRGAVIGAGSVITKDVDDGCIVAGNPAKIIDKNCNPAII